MGSSKTTPPMKTDERHRAEAPKPQYKDSDVNLDNKNCEECGLDNDEEKLLLCEKCDKGFHLYCLKPVLVGVPRDVWFCLTCSMKEKQLKSFPVVQTKIIDFFQVKRVSGNTQKQNQDNCKKRKRPKSVCVKKKKRKLLPFNPSEDPARRLLQMQSLATALVATGAEFSNELTYMPDMTQRSANCAALEKGGMQVKHKNLK